MAVHGVAILAVMFLSVGAVAGNTVWDLIYASNRLREVSNPKHLISYWHRWMFYSIQTQTQSILFWLKTFQMSTFCVHELELFFLFTLTAIIISAMDEFFIPGVENDFMVLSSVSICNL